MNWGKLLTAGILHTRTRFGVRSRGRALGLDGTAERRPDGKSAENGTIGGIPNGTYHKVSSVRLELMDGLEIVESGLGAWEPQGGRCVHETELSIDVCQLFLIG